MRLGTYNVYFISTFITEDKDCPSSEVILVGYVVCSCVMV